MRGFLQVLLIVALVASIGANVWLYQDASEAEKELDEIQEAIAEMQSEFEEGPFQAIIPVLEPFWEHFREFLGVGAGN